MHKVAAKVREGQSAPLPTIAEPFGYRPFFAPLKSRERLLHQQQRAEGRHRQETGPRKIRREVVLAVEAAHLADAIDIQRMNGQSADVVELDRDSGRKVEVCRRGRQIALVNRSVPLLTMVAPA